MGISPKVISSLRLMAVGVIYLVAVSYDNVEGIIMDALTFEIVFDLEAKSYQWTMGDVHDTLLEYEDTKTDEDGNVSLCEESARFLWPVARMAISMGLTFALDSCAMHISKSNLDDTISSWILRQTRSEL